MDTIMQSQVFFFISSVGFIIIWALVIVVLYYLIRISHTFSRIMDKAEEDIDAIGDTTREILEEMRESSLFSFFTKFFKHKRNKNKSHEKK